MQKPAPWLGISLIIALLLSGASLWLQRVPPAPQLGAPARVETLQPGVGVHTRLTGLGDEALIARTLGQVREMGATTIVDLFPWAYIQPRSPHGYDWYGADLLIAHARSQGLTVVARLDFVPAWARPAGTNDRYLDPEHYQDYANFVAAFAERYGPQGVTMLQIWNEPNLRFEWGDRAPDPAAYAELLRVVYPTVKAVAPEAQIIVAGMAPGGPTGPIDERALSANDLEYFAALLAAEAPFDMVAVHAYGGTAPYDEEPAPERVNFRRTELYRAMLEAAGRPVPLIITEGGWNDHPRWGGAVSPPERVRNTVGAYRLAAERWPWLVATCLWQFSLPSPAYNYVDNYTFVSPEGEPRAVYYAVQRWARRGEGPP